MHDLAPELQTSGEPAGQRLSNLVFDMEGHLVAAFRHLEHVGVALPVLVGEDGHELLETLGQQVEGLGLGVSLGLGLGSGLGSGSGFGFGFGLSLGFGLGLSLGSVSQAELPVQAHAEA